MVTRHACPKCQSGDELWEGGVMSGYYEINERLERTSGFEVDGAFTEGDGRYGCACGWEGFVQGLIVLGIDDKPLPKIHPRQMTLEAA